jgi:hypothetical protein
MKLNTIVYSLARRAAAIVLLPALLAACASFDAPLLTPTYALSGPTIAPSPQRFFGPPTEGPPPESGSLGISDPTAAALPPSGALPPLAVNTPGTGPGQPVEFPTFDGTLLTGELYQSSADRQPGVLLLGPLVGDWGDFPAQLMNAGFTVLVMNLRDGADERDVQAMIDALVSGPADPAHIAAVGASQGADLALRGCALLPVCDTVVLLSPLDESVLLNALPQFNPRPIMLAASAEDADSFSTAQALDAAATGDKLFQPFEQAGHGIGLLNNRPDLSGLIVEWLQRQLT